MRGDLTLSALEQWVGASAPSLPQDPLAVFVLAAALVGLAGGLAWQYRYLNRPRAAEFRDRLAAKDRIAVLMHPNPDPDAMASALGVKHLAEQVGTDAALQYPGEIRHQENRAFQTVLDLDFDRIESAADLAADAVVLVDHNEPRGFDGAADVEPYAVVDHHPGSGEGKVYTDVRPGYGACSTILAEYFESLDAEYSQTDFEEIEQSDALLLTTELATGLTYGIQSDTKHLTNGCSSADFDASSYLFPAVDERKLDRIASPLIDTEVINIKKKAIGGLDVRPPNAISDVGTVDNVDAIPQAADELTRVECVTSVIVVGEKDGVLHLSGRSRDDRVHMGRVLEKVVDDIPMSSAGGHARMGGGQISIEYMNGIGPSKGLDRKEFLERLFAALEGKEPAARSQGKSASHA